MRKSRKAARHPPSRRPRGLSGPIMIQQRLSSLYAAYITAVAGIDLDGVALIDEQRHAHLSAGLHRGGLERVGRGVALDSGFGISDLQHSLHRHLRIKHRLGGSIADHLHHAHPLS